MKERLTAKLRNLEAGRPRTTCFIFLDQIFFDDDPQPAPPAALDQAALQNAEISRDALQFSRDQWEEGKPRREWELQTARTVADANLATQRTQNDIAEGYYSQYRDVFQPLEREMVDEARTWDTSARREARASEAQADVSSSFDAMRANRQRQLQGQGFNPASGRFQGSELNTDIAQGAASAGAANTARRQVETEGYGRKMNAAQLGRNLPANQSASASLGINAGGAANSAAMAPGASSARDSSAYYAGMGPAVSANQSSAAISSNMWNQALSGYQDYVGHKEDQYGMIGQGIGSIAGMFKSSRTFKKSVVDLDADKVVEGFRKTKSNNEYSYKAGEGDNARHVGPMAEDVHRNFGEAAAPGGKHLDPISMHGLEFTAIGRLAERLEAIEGALGLGQASKQAPRRSAQTDGAMA